MTRPTSYYGIKSEMTEKKRILKIFLKYAIYKKSAQKKLSFTSCQWN